MAVDPVRLAVFISGKGSNLQALIDACAQEDYPAQIALVVSNIPDAGGLERAQKANIETLVISHRDYADKAEFEDALLNALAPYDIEILCLAGFMRILSADFITRWEKPLINIHPSLLPDYKGLDTHARALADGKKEAGCTVHHVSADVDSGEIIVQKKVPIFAGDTPETLAKRILPQEHIAYPEAVLALAKGLR